ncbi:MAG: hypothetical protein ACTH87_05060 [Enterococcus italicus]
MPKVATNQSKQDKLYERTLKTIGAVAKLPIIRVNRKKFLKEQFAGSPDLDKILKYGPQSVYSSTDLRQKATEIIKSSTKKTSIASFAAGMPSNPLIMLAAGSADVAQYFAFAINMAQQIAYLFGEEDLFTSKTDELSEEAKLRIIAYLGVMFGAGGAAFLVSKVSKQAGEHLGQRIATKTLSQTTWFPLVKKVGAKIGQNITQESVQKTVTKSVPIIGGVISGGLTYVTFIPMGNRLADAFVMHLDGTFEDSPKTLMKKQHFLDRFKRRQKPANEVIEGEFKVLPLEEEKE